MVCQWRAQAAINAVSTLMSSVGSSGHARGTTEAAVPSSRAILIHPGNVPADTDGCLLPGKSKGDDRIGQSLGLYEEIKQLMVDKGIENFNVLITSCYVDCKK